MMLMSVAALALSATADAATLNKCIDAKGDVTYSNLPCRNARQARTVEIDPAPQPDPVRSVPVRTKPSKPIAADSPARTPEPVTTRLDTQRTTGKLAPQPSAKKCDTLTDKLGRVFDKMDQARRKGYTQDQMDKWNQEVKDLERQKQQSGCF
jgi:hypothetical protein